MILQLEEYILNNWNDLLMSRSKPKGLLFLKLEAKASKNASIPFLIFPDDQYRPILFAKVPRNPNYTSYIEKEYQNLSTIHETTSSSYVLNAIPKPLSLDKISNCFFLLETSVCGKKIENAIRKRKKVRKLYSFVLDWLIEFHKETMVGRSKINELFIEKYIRKPSEIFLNNFDLLPPSLKNSIAKALDNITRVGDDRVTVPIVSQHGDFNPYNIFISNNALKVIDWEDSLIHSPPHLDLNHFLINTLHSLEGKKKSLNYYFKIYITKKGRYAELFNEVIERYCHELKIEKEVFDAFFPLYLVQMANKDMEEQRAIRWSALNWVNMLKIYLDHETF